MEFTVYSPNLTLLMEAVGSVCQNIRFGSEFCMYALPTKEELESAYRLVVDSGKNFEYVTPRLSDKAVSRVREHLTLLNNMGSDITVVANDLGILRALKGLPNLRPHLGRQLVYMPSRCPWQEISEQPISIFARRKIEHIFYQTSLNYAPTIEFFKSFRVIGADVDWVPQCFKSLSFLSKAGLKVSIHMHIIPAAITRKCHMARFLGVESFENCSRPCYLYAYSMKNDALRTQLFLHGNAIFRLIEPKRKELNQLIEAGVSNLVLSMNPLTRIKFKAQIDDLVKRLSTMY
jgi:hypothetical protein